MAEPIPDKGRVLTAMTAFWCERARRRRAECALVTCDPDERSRPSVPGVGQDPALAGRTTLARRAEMVPLECVVRGRLAGSAFEEYRRRGTIHSMPAPSGLELTDALHEPMFTPSTKADRRPRRQHLLRRRRCDRGRGARLADTRRLPRRSSTAASRARRGRRARARRHEVRARPHRRRARPVRRGRDAGLVADLAGRRDRPRGGAARVRQAAVPRLARRVSRGTARRPRRASPTTSSSRRRAATSRRTSA